MVSPKLQIKQKKTHQPNWPIKPYLIFHIREPLPDGPHTVSSNLVLDNGRLSTEALDVSKEPWRNQIDGELRQDSPFIHIYPFTRLSWERCLLLSGKCGRVTQFSTVWTRAALKLNLADEVWMSLAYRWSYFVPSLKEFSCLLREWERTTLRSLFLIPRFSSDSKLKTLLYKDGSGKWMTMTRLRRNLVLVDFFSLALSLSLSLLSKYIYIYI